MVDDHPGLVLQDCVKFYGTTIALQEVSLSVAPGEVVGLVGANGAGKTTLLHSLVGLLDLDRGTMRLGGHDIRHPLARALMAFVPDDLPRPRHLSAVELVNLTCRLYGVRPDAERLAVLAERYQLDGSLRKRLSSFSHGMSRKADLIAALMVRPWLLVMDEPFSGLDPVMVEHMLTDIAMRREAGLATFLSTHDLELAARVCDRVVMIHHGAVIADAPPAALVAASDARDIRGAFAALSGVS